MVGKAGKKKEKKIKKMIEIYFHPHTLCLVGATADGENPRR